MGIELKTSGLPELQTHLLRAEQFFGNPQPLLKVWGVSLLKVVDDNFRTSGKPPWRPLQPSTIAARRVGKGKGGPQPLQNTGALRRSFDFTTEARRLVVFSENPVAVFHQFGTRGPYEIRPKHGKVLAIPTGPMSFAGLGASKARATGGGFIFRPRGKVPKRFAGRIGKAVQPFKGVRFVTKVTHPGLPARPMLPTPEQAIPVLIRDGSAYLQKVIGRG